MSLLLLIMFFEIVSICCRHADPNGVPHLLPTLQLEGVVCVCVFVCVYVCVYVCMCVWGDDIPF